MDTIGVLDSGSLGRSAPSGPSLILERPLWQADDACLWAEPETFFPAKGESGREAKRICARCPVQAQCLDFALDYAGEDLYGIWAGTTMQERQRLRRQDRKRRYRTRAA